MDDEAPVPLRRRPSTASYHGFEDTEIWPDARTPPPEGEGVESSIPAPSNPVPVVVYFDRASTQSFLDTFAPHTRLFPNPPNHIRIPRTATNPHLTDHIGRSKAQHVQLEFQYARFYYELTQILDTAMSMEREAAIHWQAITDQHRQMQTVLDQQRTHSQEVYRLLKTVHQREEAVQQAWTAFQAALHAYTGANALYARVAMLGDYKFFGHRRRIWQFVTT